MELEIENIGLIKNAHIILNGITLIAGENDVGKSTVGRSLYSLFECFRDYKTKIKKQKMKAFLRKLSNALINPQDRFEIPYNRSNFRKVLESRHEDILKFISKEEDLSIDFLSDLITQLNKSGELKIDSNPEFLEKTLDELSSVISVSDQEILSRILTGILDKEFSGQINNLFEKNSTGNISLKIKDEVINVQIQNNTVKKIDNPISINHSIEYLDDPFVIDSLERFFHPWLDEVDNHREKLKRNLMKKSEENEVEQILTDKTLEPILEKLNSIVNGELKRNSNSLRYVYSTGAKNDLNIENTSAGLKTFIILKTLLQNNSLEKNGIIILDEPEIHLHPKWQITFAELIVLIQKNFNMHILMTTHSPYFINAIEVFSKKYNVDSKYYLAEIKNRESTISDVTSNTEPIYEKLARPLQILENLRYKSDNG